MGHHKVGQRKTCSQEEYKVSLKATCKTGTAGQIAMSMLQTLAKVHPSLISNEKIETSQRCLTLAMIRNCNEALT